MNKKKKTRQNFIPPNYYSNCQAILFIITKDFLKLKHDQKQIKMIVRRVFFKHIPFLPTY